MAANDTIITFTSRSREEILETGGSQMWRLRPRRARRANFLICARHKFGEHGGGPEEHKSGFLIGRISAVVPAPEDPRRWLIRIEEWADIDLPDLWEWGRNPIHYADLEDFDVDADSLDWKPLKVSAKSASKSSGVKHEWAGPLTIEQAKRALAATFGVKPDAIEITVHG